MEGGGGVNSSTERCFSWEIGQKEKEKIFSAPGGEILGGLVKLRSQETGRRKILLTASRRGETRGWPGSEGGFGGGGGKRLPSYARKEEKGLNVGRKRENKSARGGGEGRGWPISHGKGVRA